MNFDDEYKKIFSDKKLSEDFISSLAEKMAEEASAHQNNIISSEADDDINTPVIKKSSENIFVIFKKFSIAAAFTGIVLSVSILAAISKNNISSSKKGTIMFHDSKSVSSEATTTETHSDTENISEADISGDTSQLNSEVPGNDQFHENSSVPENSSNQNKTTTGPSSVSSAETSSVSKTSETTADDGIVRWPVEKERQKNSLVEFSFSNPTVDLTSSDRTVEVDMNIGKNTGFTAFVFCIQYDKSALELKNIISNLPVSSSDKGDKVPALELTKIKNKSYDTICFFNPESAVFHPVTKNNFTCCKLIFEVKPNAQPGKYIINRIAPDKRETELINVLDNDHTVVKPDFSFGSGSITVKKSSVTTKNNADKNKNTTKKKSEK